MKAGPGINPRILQLRAGFGWLLVSALVTASSLAASPQDSPPPEVAPAGSVATPTVETEATVETATAPPVDPSEAAGTEPSTEKPVGEDAAPATSDEAGEAPPPPPAEGERVPPAKPTTLGQQWLERVEDLETALLERRAEPEEADELYPHLVQALNSTSQQLVPAMDDESEEAHTIYKDMASLYVARLNLLDLVTPFLRGEIKGFDATGIEEAKGELKHIQRHTRYQFESVRHRSRGILEEYLASPLKAFREIFLLLMTIVIFRWWRRSGSRGIQTWRQKLMALRPRRRRNIRLAKLLWYVDRVRAPIEWLFVFKVLMALLRMQEAQYLGLIWVVIKWLLLGGFAILLIDAMAARGAAGITRDQSGLRLRSLRWVGGWFVLRGMILELVASYGGEGTIYSWFATLALVTMFPILVMLVSWWREEIFLRLSERKDLPDFIVRLQRKTTGISGFISAAIGGTYLLVQGVLRRLLRLLANFELGKRALAYFFRREVARQSERQRTLALGRPVSLEIAERLLRRDGTVQEKVARGELQSLITLARSVERGRGALIGERGAGKSRLLERLKESQGDAVLLVDCPPGNFQGLLGEMARELGLPPEAVGDRDAIHRAITESGIEVVAVDNYHRLTVPAVGGLDEIDQLISFEAGIGPEVSWIISLDAAAWQYIRRLRSDLLLAHQVVEIKRWSDQQIANFIEARNKDAGIDPDFDQLVLPAHLNESDFEGEESTQTGFYRIIWDSAKGNPEVAIRLWVDSLVTLDDGTLAVRLFPPANYDELERLDLLMLFGLRSIMRLEMATPEEIRRSLRISDAQVGEILRSALNMGLIEELGGRYSVPWKWYRPLSTVLMRQNLMKV